MPVDRDVLRYVECLGLSLQLFLAENPKGLFIDRGSANAR
jgi:hypothetical protein